VPPNAEKSEHHQHQRDHHDIYSLTARELLSADMLGEIAKAKIVITNFHAKSCRTVHDHAALLRCGRSRRRAFGSLCGTIAGGRGANVLVLEAQNRVGGRTLTGHFGDGTFVDDGGQWVSPGQDCIDALAEQLGVRLFPSWSEGATVHWRAGGRIVSKDLFLPEDGDALSATRQAAAAPPSSVMNSRRFTQSPRRRARANCLRF